MTRLPYPFGHRSLQQQQPLVMLGENVLAKTMARTGMAVLRTAACAEHVLVPITTASGTWRNALRDLWPIALAKLQAELPRQAVEMQSDAFAYFTKYLVPAFHQRDVSEAESIPN